MLHRNSLGEQSNVCRSLDLWDDSPEQRKSLERAVASGQVTSARHSGLLGGVSVLLANERLRFPLPQPLHLPCAQSGQILLLHVHAAKRGPKRIVGDVLLLFSLGDVSTKDELLVDVDASVWTNQKPEEDGVFRVTSIPEFSWRSVRVSKARSSEP